MFGLRRKHHTETTNSSKECTLKIPTIQGVFIHYWYPYDGLQRRYVADDGDAHCAAVISALS